MVALGLAVALLSGCQREVDPEMISATVQSFGRYEIRGGIPIRVESVSSIRCEQGVVFGVEYRIGVASGQSGILPVEFRWVHPELAVPERKLWGTQTPALAANPILRRDQSSLEGRALWSLEDPGELVSGRWEIQIRLREDGTVLAAHAFDLEGC